MEINTSIWAEGLNQIKLISELDCHAAHGKRNFHTATVASG